MKIYINHSLDELRLVLIEKELKSDIIIPLVLVGINFINGDIYLD